MKQLVLLSGKGGTGKTSLAAAFAYLAHEGCAPLDGAGRSDAGDSAAEQRGAHTGAAMVGHAGQGVALQGCTPVKAVLADADVDAANLELALQPKRLATHEFMGGAVAVIDLQRCQGCGVCEQVCRFDAIHCSERGYEVDPINCDGCASCVFQCPEDAIHMQPQLAGHWYASASRYGPLYHAELRPAQENSGKLVTLVKQQARLAALDGGYPLLIVDGPPGVGCPVISAISGADVTLIVAEPTVSGVHDMQRILETAAHFRIPALVCINKADIYPEGASKIEATCRERGIALVGRIPFDETVTQAMMNGEPVNAYRPNSPAALAIQSVWENTARHLGLRE